MMPEVGVDWLATANETESGMLIRDTVNPALGQPTSGGGCEYCE